MDHYQSPFSERYASQEMRALFSPQTRYSTFRKLWTALAKTQKSLGLPIKDFQIKAMEKAVHKINFAKANSYEKKFRHDVMAHIHAFGDACPEAKGIIHLGATSCFVTDNTDLILMKEGIQILQKNLSGILQKLLKLAKEYADLPCVGFTHFQPAQPTTVGKRISLWLQDFVMDAKQGDHLLLSLPFLGSKGATGTQNSFLLLFEGDHKKVKKVDELLAKEFQFTKALTVTGQTYPRKWDLQIFHYLQGFAASSHKMATDLRLLAHMGEMGEKASGTQVGSSAMPHKQNPIYSERICGLARFLISLAENPAYTASLQWLERSLDDSSNRRIVIPEAFLAADALIMLLAHVLDNLYVDQGKIKAHLEEHLPSLIKENLLTFAALHGKDRQEIHESLRKEKPGANPEKFAKAFLTKLKLNPSASEIKKLINPDGLIGRSKEQTLEFLKDDVEPYLKKRRGKAAIATVSV